jgi:hypothetical protein
VRPVGVAACFAAAIGLWLVAPSWADDSQSVRAPARAERPGQPAANGSWQLKYKFQQGQDVRFQLELDSDIAVQQAGVASKSNYQSAFERHFHVSAVEPDGSAVLDLFIDSVQLTYSFDDHPRVTYDTRNEKVSPPQGFERVKDSVGRLLGQAKMSPRGKLVKLTRPLQGASDDSSQNFLDVLPEGPVQLGDQWHDDIQVKIEAAKNLTQRITIRRRYTLESVDAGVATIRVQSAELTPIEDPRVIAQIAQQTPEGTILFDIEKGMTTARDLRCSRVVPGAAGPGSVLTANCTIKGALK